MNDTKADCVLKKNSKVCYGLKEKNCEDCSFYKSTKEFYRFEQNGYVYPFNISKAEYEYKELIK